MVLMSGTGRYLNSSRVMICSNFEPSFSTISSLTGM
jgi:hypothetical protein